MRKILITILVMTLVGILAGGACLAGVPGSISYQGKLTNALGQPVSDRAYPVQFKLYAEGILFWTSAVQNVTTSGGVFTTQLTPLAASDLAGKTDVWMEIWVGSPLAALFPRTEFTSVPYALISGDSWSLLGNAGTIPGTNFIGTTDDKALEFKVHGTRGFRLEPTSGAPNVIGGYSGNTVTAGFAGATISGGGASSLPNRVTSSFGAVGGGVNNTAGDQATVGGGYDNAATGSYATVAGGFGNRASGNYATVPGGNYNTALGIYSFAAGQRAKANNIGAFVWADSTAADFASTGNNQFLIRASGGVGIGISDPIAGALDVNGLIRSRTGGFRFPDGTTQTTAAWGLTGNAGTTPGTNFIGTTDDMALEFRVNNSRGFRLEPASGRTPNVIGGDAGNTVTAGACGATISGGGTSVKPNSVINDFGTVGGGALNIATHYGTVGGGDDNTASTYATVGGGGSNNAGGYAATVAGGFGNAASGNSSTVGGGYDNAASSSYATVAGGYDSAASGYSSNVGGGFGNAASGNYATVPGGYNNAAFGTYSFAAGQQARANNDGAFVWADSTAAYFASTAANQFLIRASGGVGIGTTAPTHALTVQSPNTSTLRLIGPEFYGQTAKLNFGDANYVYLQEDVDDGLTIYAGGRTAIMGGYVGIGTSAPGYKLDVNGDVNCSGIYRNISDLRYKTNIATIGNALDKVMKLRGINFDWKKSDYPDLAFGGERQVGFVAQEIEQVLPEVVSKDSKGIYSVAYASVVPLLVEAMKEQQKTIDELKARLAAIEAKSEQN